MNLITYVEIGRGRGLNSPQRHMAVEEFINASSDLAPQVLSEVGQLASWIQAIGVVVILWLIFNVVSLIVNLKRKKELEKIRADIGKLSRKIDKKFF